MIKTLSISKIKPNTGQIDGLPKNPRFIRDERFEKLKRSIKELPSMLELRELIVVPQNGHFVTIGGNMRLRAAKDLGLTELPCKVLDKDTDVNVLAEIAVKDNVGFGQDDYDLIANEWTDFPLADWGMELPDYEAVEEPGDADAEPQIDKAAELNKKWKVQAGDLWSIGEHRLLCGSCTESADVQKLMGKERANAVLTDPPYGQSQDGVPNDDPEGHRDLMLDAVGNLPIDDGVIVAFQSPRLFVNWLDALSAYQYKFERMLWMYKAAQCTFPWRGWILTSESILVATKGEGAWQDVHPFSHDCYYLSEVSGELDKDSGWHGSVKPLKVVSDLLSRICPLGSIVYEPFCGSGTTIVACQNLGRKCRAIELTPDYCAVILERMSTAFPDLEIKRIEDAKGKATN